MYIHICCISEQTTFMKILKVDSEIGKFMKALRILPHLYHNMKIQKRSLTEKKSAEGSGC